LSLFIIIQRKINYIDDNHLFLKKNLENVTKVASPVYLTAIKQYKNALLVLSLYFI